MSEYFRGARSEHQITGAKNASKSNIAFVYVGTAPVHTVAGGAANVNKPVLVKDIAEARRLFGYSDDWANYTLCEAMYVHLEHKGVGPLVLINVLDPAAHKATESGSVSLTPKNGRITIPNAGEIILDSVAVTGKEKDVDYRISYDHAKKAITLVEMKNGGLGNEALSITYDSVDPSMVDSQTVIGATDGNGLNTGLYAIKNVYQMTGYIPSYLLAPGFSTDPEVHKAMLAAANKVNKHWDAIVYSDIPLVDKDGNAVTLQTAYLWREQNGYNHANGKSFYPLYKGKDGNKYHISVSFAANLQQLLVENGGVPYMSASNTECDLLESLYMGEDMEGRVFDDALLSETLNQHGITTAAYVSGRWVVWGSHGAAYDYSKGVDDPENLAAQFDTSRQMMYWYGNDFQHRRGLDVDKPLSINDLQSIVAQERAKLEALVEMKALTYAEAFMNTADMGLNDVMNGRYAFGFKMTVTPLGRELIGQVYQTTDGFEIYYDALMAQEF